MSSQDYNLGWIVRGTPATGWDSSLIQTVPTTDAWFDFFGSGGGKVVKLGDNYYNYAYTTLNNSTLTHHGEYKLNDAGTYWSNSSTLESNWCMRSESIWTDGTNYYGIANSFSGTTLGSWFCVKWNSSLEKWERYNGFNHDVYGMYVWTDGTNTYYSSGGTHYVLQNGSWVDKDWGEYNSVIDGRYIWNYHGRTFFSLTSQLYLDKVSGKFTPFTWNGVTSFSGNMVFKDRGNVYVRTGTSSALYILDYQSHTWSASGLSSAIPSVMWNYKGRAAFAKGDDTLQSPSYQFRLYVMD